MLIKKKNQCGSCLLCFQAFLVEVMFSSVTWNAQLDWLFFQVTRAMLLWVNNHYSDFEGDSVMEGYLETFEKGLEIQVSGRLLFILGEFSTSFGCRSFWLFF